MKLNISNKMRAPETKKQKLHPEAIISYSNI